MGDALSNKEVLDMVPQQEPFRFIDEIVELDEAVSLAAQLVGYHWRLRPHRRHHGNADAASLGSFDEAAEITVA